MVITGYPYDFDTQFPCGSMQSSGAQPLYYYSTSGCCQEGLPFDNSQQYCCFDGIHDYSSGYCGAWSATASDPTCYDCTTSKKYWEKTHANMKQSELHLNSTAVQPIDTTIENTVDPCYTATSTDGCLNLYSYNFTTSYPCGSWILTYESYGCCNGAIIILIFCVYRFFDVNINFIINIIINVDIEIITDLYLFNLDYTHTHIHVYNRCSLQFNSRQLLLWC